MGRIDDSADEWIDDDLLRKVIIVVMRHKLCPFIVYGIFSSDSAVDNYLSTSSVSSRTYGSRDRTFDFLDVEDDKEDIFNDDLNVRNMNCE